MVTGLLFVSLLGVNSYANTEKLLGPVVAAERTYQLDMNKIIENLKMNRNGFSAESKVQVFPKDTLLIMGRISNEDTEGVSFETANTRVYYMIDNSGYSVQVFETKNKPITYDQVVAAINETFPKAQTHKFTTTVLKVQK